MIASLFKLYAIFHAPKATHRAFEVSVYLRQLLRQLALKLNCPHIVQLGTSLEFPQLLRDCSVKRVNLFIQLPLNALAIGSPHIVLELVVSQMGVGVPMDSTIRINNDIKGRIGGVSSDQVPKYCLVEFPEQCLLRQNIILSIVLEEHEAICVLLRQGWFMDGYWVDPEIFSHIYVHGMTIYHSEFSFGKW